MLRFLAGCVVVAALCIGAVIMLGKGVPETLVLLGLTKATETTDDDQQNGNASPRPVQNPKDEPKGTPDVDAPVARTTADRDDNKLAAYVKVVGRADVQPIILQEGRILTTERPDVPSERDGKLLFVATPARPGEFVPARKLMTFEVPTLAIEVTESTFSALPESERIIDVDAPKDKFYRAVRPTDSLAPGTTVVVRQLIRFRKLEVGDRVREGQVLGVINPALAVADLYIKQQKIEGADSEVRGAGALKTEYERRLAAMRKLNAVQTNAVTKDEIGATEATLLKYKEEEIMKRAAVKTAQKELGAALTTLKMHTIHSPIDGVIKSFYKQAGESVKNLEPVLQVQNPKLLRVDSEVEIQDALTLRDRLEQARKYRDAALQIRAKKGEAGEKEALQYDAWADRILAVEVEASRIEPPRAVLSGHLQEVTCVAVSKGSKPKIVSGSEDRTVRVWEKDEDGERWHEKARLDHYAIVRAVACTPATAEKNLLLTATSTGRGRLFDLDALEDPEKQIMLNDRHAGPINAVAFNADGTICATGGEDRAICLWQTRDGTLLGRYKGAHRDGVTSLAFTPKDQLVSAGKDRRLIVWDLVAGGVGGRTLKQADSFDRRSGEVAQLGIDADGTHVLFDEGRELRVLSLEKRKIEGTLANPSGAGSFTTMALYSPDGSTILTNGNATGRLQLWRAPRGKVRSSELRQFPWSKGTVTSGAFDPNGAFVATGTTDSRVLVWAAPSKAEAERPIAGQLSYVEEFLDTSLKRVAVRAMLENPGWIIPGGTATIVVPPLPTK